MGDVIFLSAYAVSFVSLGLSTGSFLFFVFMSCEFEEEWIQKYISRSLIVMSLSGLFIAYAVLSLQYKRSLL